MADPFVAEIRIFAGNFAPRGWALCNGQLLPISQNTALFSLLGTFYGGDGKSTFALPDMQGNAPMFWGQGPGLSNRDLGEMSGSSTVTLLTTEMPAHGHSLVAKAAPAATAVPAPAVILANTTLATAIYNTAGVANANLAAQALGVAGSSLPHNNMQPYLVLTFIIALQGVFPPGVEPLQTDVALRPVTAADEPLLRAVYASTRTEELAQVDWDDTQKDAFLRMQFDAQHHYYSEVYSEAQFLIVEQAGEPIGRLYVHRREDEIRIVDISLLPPARRRGVGSALLRQILAEGAAAGKPVTIHVERFNPALQLYHRLGFTVLEERGVYFLMEWRPT